jgi:hypothetical protein
MTDGREIDSAQTAIRLAGAADAPAVGRLLHAFSAEFGAPGGSSRGASDRPWNHELIERVV